jgi:hypothetical protein
MKANWNACCVLVRKPKEKRPLERPRHGWDDVKMDLSGIGLGGMD